VNNSVRRSVSSFSASRDVEKSVIQCDVWSCDGQASRYLYHPFSNAHRSVCLSCAEEMIHLGGWVDHTNERRLRTGGVTIDPSG
jgi:hypothetical protein